MLLFFLKRYGGNYDFLIRLISDIGYFYCLIAIRNCIWNTLLVKCQMLPIMFHVKHFKFNLWLDIERACFSPSDNMGWIDQQY